MSKQPKTGLMRQKSSSKQKYYDSVKLNITKLSLCKDNRPELKKPEGPKPGIVSKSKVDNSAHKHTYNKYGKTRYIYTAETAKCYHDMSERVAYKRRLHMTNKPLIIVYYDGVIGFTNKGNTYMRPGVHKFIHKIWPDFQIGKFFE